MHDFENIGRFLEENEYWLSRHSTFRATAELYDYLTENGPPDLTYENMLELSQEDFIKVLKMLSAPYLTSFEPNLPRIERKWLRKANLSEQGQKLPPLDLTKDYLEKPLVRGMRKSWAGKPRVQTQVESFEPLKSYGYVKRSFKRHKPELTGLQTKRNIESLKRSLAHTILKLELSYLKSQELELDSSLYNAYWQYSEHLLKEAQPTAAMRDAWDEYIPSNAIATFVADTYAPTIRAFADAPALLNEFIGAQWDNYGKAARIARQERYGMNLTAEQINALQDADLSFLED